MLFQLYLQLKFISYRYFSSKKKMGCKKTKRETGGPNVSVNNSVFNNMLLFSNSPIIQKQFPIKTNFKFSFPEYDINYIKIMFLFCLDR